MKKKIFSIAVVFFLTTYYIKAQVGIGTANPNSSAILDLVSNKRALLLPRLPSSSIVAPVNGMLIYDSSYACFKGYSNGQWSDCDLTVFCGAYVSPGVLKKFLCHNLGVANTSLDPNIVVEGIHGKYYQWGSKGESANTSTPSGRIWEWKTTVPASTAWVEGSKTANDPCPSGYRIPTEAQWNGVFNSGLNTMTRSGSWLDDGNFTTSISFLATGKENRITLPAAGGRNSADGTLVGRGVFGTYWSAKNLSGSGRAFTFTQSTVGIGTYDTRSGYSIRCIEE